MAVPRCSSQHIGCNQLKRYYNYRIVRIAVDLEEKAFCQYFLQNVKPVFLENFSLRQTKFLFYLLFYNSNLDLSRAGAALPAPLAGP
jgi:hypothetical protein